MPSAGDSTGSLWRSVRTACIRTAQCHVEGPDGPSRSGIPGPRRRGRRPGPGQPAAPRHRRGRACPVLRHSLRPGPQGAGRPAGDTASDYLEARGETEERIQLCPQCDGYALVRRQCQRLSRTPCRPSRAAWPSRAAHGHLALNVTHETREDAPNQAPGFRPTDVGTLQHLRQQLRRGTLRGRSAPTATPAGPAGCPTPCSAHGPSPARRTRQRAAQAPVPISPYA